MSVGIVIVNLFIRGDYNKNNVLMKPEMFDLNGDKIYINLKHPITLNILKKFNKDNYASLFLHKEYILKMKKLNKNKNIDDNQVLDQNINILLESFLNKKMIIDGEDYYIQSHLWNGKYEISKVSDRYKYKRVGVNVYVYVSTDKNNKGITCNSIKKRIHYNWNKLLGRNTYTRKIDMRKIKKRKRSEREKFFDERERFYDEKERFYDDKYRYYKRHYGGRNMTKKKKHNKNK